MPESAISTSRPRVLSGMRPTGKLHLGNYMGALANWVKLQDPYECYFFIADLHALTTDYADTSKIAPNTLEVALDFLAAGLDPEKCTIFVQSHVTQHSELPLLLGMITPLGWLERVPSYKEMQENLASKDLTTFGFLGYPVLMASDILLYQADFVPVGQDQQAHVELTREVARRFNQFYPKAKAATSTLEGLDALYGSSEANSEGLEGLYGLSESEVQQKPKQLSAFRRAAHLEYVLPEPQVLLTPSPLEGLDALYGSSEANSEGLEGLYGLSESEVQQKPKQLSAFRRAAHLEAAHLEYVLPEPQVLLTPSPKLPGTDGRKMSKSYGNTILLTDPEPVVRQKLKTMVTDPARVRRTDAGDPDKCPVGDLHKVFSPPETLAKMYDGCRSAGIGCIECKSWAADGLVRILQPIQERRAGFTETQVVEILKEGSRRARVRAEQTMEQVRAAMQMTRDSGQ
jgi:tryptophanyl-tRNA synthetase